MKIKTCSKVAALPVLMLSAITAHAATNGDALQACSEAIATSIEKQQGAELKLRVDASSIDPGRRLHNDTLFHLDAVDPATDNVVGRFDCRVNRRAHVRSLYELSPDAPSAIVRAKI